MFFSFIFLLGMGSRPSVPPSLPSVEVLKPIEVQASKDDIVKISREITTDNAQFRATLLKAIEAAEGIINSQAFAERVLRARFTTTKDSSEKVLDNILNPKDKFDVVWVFERHRSSKVLGWTYPSEKRIWFNTRNFAGRSVKGLTGTVCHELMHKIGYGHKSAKDLQSVPYSVGTICSQLYKE
jgi:hypothetical protein